MTDTKRSNSGVGSLLAGLFFAVGMFLFGGIGGKNHVSDMWTQHKVHAAEQAQAQKNAQADAQQKDAGTQYVLGMDYSLGQGGYSVNNVQAAIHLRKAIDEGDTDAYWFLGMSYLNGEGVPQDYAEAYFLFDLATAYDSPNDHSGTIYRNEAASHLTRSVLLATQERARKWLESHPSN